MVDFVNETFRQYKTDGRYEAAHQKWIGRNTGQKAQPPTISVDEAVELVKKNAG